MVYIWNDRLCGRFSAMRYHARAVSQDSSAASNFLRRTRVKPRSRTLLDKSVGALLAAIEIYNKPVFEYREETFAILAVNAWELLIKARILQLASNKMASILEYEKRRRADGTMSEQNCRRRNRAGNLTTVGLFSAMDILAAEYGAAVDSSARKNLEALVEIRDNAVHFTLTVGIHEIGAASVKNYISAARQWFGENLSDKRLFLMPLAFVSGVAVAEGLGLNAEERHLGEYLDAMKSGETGSPDEKDFNVALTIEISMKRSKTGEGGPFTISSLHDAVPIRMEEADLRDRYPWDYGVLTQRLKLRYEDFKSNAKYHEIRKALESQPKYSRERLLDPGKPDGLKKRFYNEGIVKAFDPHYTRRKAIHAGEAE